MALVEYYLGTVGPLYIDDTDPLYSEMTQVALKQDVSDTGALLSDHIAAADPHPQYLTSTEGDAAYAVKSAEIKFTSEGGLAILLVNKTGAASVKGEVVTVYNDTAVDNAVEKIVVDVPNAIGVFLESGVADGAQAWIVISGKASVYFGGSTTRGHLARTTVTGDAFTTTGYALSEAVPSPPFATDKHFCEIGHVLESRTGAGLAKVNLHFN